MSKKNSQGIVIGTKEEALWTEVRDSAKKSLEELEERIILEKAFIKLAEEKILLEKRK